VAKIQLSLKVLYLPLQYITMKTRTKRERKSPGTTALIATISGLFGFLGLGHIYLGEVRRGLLLMIIGWILEIGGIALTKIFLFSTLIGVTIIGAVIGIPMLLIYFVLWIWQIFDAYNKAKEI